MSNPPLPPVPASPPPSGGVRRHHTISAASRSARLNAREVISEETHPDQPIWGGEDEPVDQDWVGNLGAVGEKASLHRQASLPTKYRGFHSGRASQTGTSTPMNSLAAITGHEEHEDVWNNINNFQVQEDEPSADLTSQASGGSVDGHISNPPLSPPGYTPAGPSPPPSGANVRRHVSLTYGAAVGGPRRVAGSGLKRAGTLQAPMPTHSQNPTPPESVAAQQEDESVYSYEEEQPTYDEEYVRQQQPQYSGNRWGSGNDWRAPGSSGFSSAAGNGQPTNIDDVSRALSALELSSNQGQNIYHSSGQSVHPPRFNPSHPPPLVLPGTGGRHQTRGSNGSTGGRSIYGTDVEGRKTPSGGYGQGNYGQSNWENKEHTLASRTSNPNLQYSYQQGAHGKAGSNGNGNDNIPNVPPIPSQYLNQANQAQNRMGNNGNFVAAHHNTNNNNNNSATLEPSSQNFLASPLDVPTLIATKGYNPITFDTKPGFARYFVIKSYTEDDVHKSLKYEIWSSTDPGNKRLDKAFKETNNRGPVYLFFSVNASGHFCGMAEMLTPVDYSRSSTVWASDKWKGVFKVRWIFVRDIPNANLRHIKLNNTQERKPVTNSRDTQELPPDAGQEMLRIFHTHPARTSLLQDFAFYELQSIQKLQQQQLNSNATSPGQSPNPSAIHSPQLAPVPLSLSSGSLSPQLPQAQTPQGAFGMTNAYQMSPMVQMQMQMGLGMGMGMAPLNMGGFALPQQQSVSPVMHQSVMRHTSPAPPGAAQHGHNQQGQNYLGAQTF